ncbi:MAG: DUF2147 domain-containing protein [Spirochaetales bacterium]|nr:DUF2147 domain-containing protein [Spirochaetales bacterium]
MNKGLIFGILFLVGLFSASAQDVTGYWKTIDDVTGEVKSVVAVYEKGGKVYGRVLAIFEEGAYLEDFRNPQKVAEETAGQPYFCGLDIIWDMEKKGDSYKKGKIMDPQNGKHYSCEMWLDGKNLMVRGKIGPIGRNQTWRPLDGSEGLPSDLTLPPLSSFTPVIPQ